MCTETKVPGRYPDACCTPGSPFGESPFRQKGPTLTIVRDYTLRRLGCCREFLKVHLAEFMMPHIAHDALQYGGQGTVCMVDAAFGSNLINVASHVLLLLLRKVLRLGPHPTQRWGNPGLEATGRFFGHELFSQKVGA